MYYFFQKRPTRLLAALLAVCLTATLFSGCQLTKKPEDTSAPTEDSLPGNLVEVKPTEDTTPTTEATEPENLNMATVKKQANVRSSPSSGAKIIGYLDPGTQVEVIKTQVYLGVEWALIREGWIALDDVEMNNSSGTDTPDATDPTTATEPAATQPANNNTTTTTGTGTSGVVTSNGLNIRKEPNTNCTIVGNYANGAKVTILETKNGWGRTDKGWVSMKYVSTNGTTTNTNTNTTTNNNTTTTTTDGATYFITASELNIRDSASTNGNKVGTYVAGDKVTVTETSNGWGKTNKGWISMQYAYKTGATGKNTAKGIVTVNGLNVRSGPGTDYGAVATYNTGSRVEILEQITIGNSTWGCTSKGWISMGYVYVDGTEGDGAGNGTITGDTVNVRSGPGTGYCVVTTLKEGDEVKILAQFDVDGTKWGCIKNGWVCMDYVGVG